MDLVIKEKYNSYPSHIREPMLKLRELVLKIANKDPEIDFVSEDLKWGEPSFITKSSGSTLRIDWKAKNPDYLSLFFNCQTKLVSIFKELYPRDFEYIGNRELRLNIGEAYSEVKLENCIKLTLKYHLIKNDF